MSLVANGSNGDTDPDQIGNNGFWPDLDSNTFRDQHRLDSAATDARLRAALRAAMADINRQLRDYQAEAIEGGHKSSEDVPIEPWQRPGEITDLYQRAVFCTAHASLMERYRDYSATGAGDESGEAKADTADDYRRDARWAVSQLTGRDHVTVELI